MKDKISIIVPVYKVEQYINRCIESIMSQTYKNIEIILVDDGSPDNCGKICDSYRKKDNRIKVIHTKNGGLSAARNMGIRNSTGKYLMFVDSDDYIKNDMVEYLYNLLIKYDSDISICNYMYTFDNNPNKNYVGINGEYESVLTTKEALSELLLDKKIQNFAWNKLYKKNLFNSVEFPINRLMEDVGTTYKLFMKSKKVVSGSEVKYFYVQRNGSILHNKDFNFYIDHYELSLERYLNIKKNYELDVNYLSMLYILFSLISVYNKEVQEYVNKNNIIQDTRKIISDMKKLKIKFCLKDKIKLLLFKTDIRLFRFVSRGWYKWILKITDFM